MDARARKLLDFWFGAKGTPGYGEKREVWWQKDAAFDAACEAFLPDHARAAAGHCDAWLETAEEALALVILLDQIPRNCFRGTPRAFAADAKAREATRRALREGFEAALPPVLRQFLCMPLMHSEALADQEESVRLAESFTDHPGREEYVDFAVRHRDIVARFGRFPHRNLALGRVSAPEEVAFLKGPNSSF